MLDRLVGYQISPLLWDKVKRGLSAGRVQTVALRLIVEREREINAFPETEYWNIDAVLSDGRSDGGRLCRAHGEREWRAAACCRTSRPKESTIANSLYRIRVLSMR